MHLKSITNSAMVIVLVVEVGHQLLAGMHASSRHRQVETSFAIARLGLVLRLENLVDKLKKPNNYINKSCREWHWTALASPLNFFFRHKWVVDLYPTYAQYTSGVWQGTEMRRWRPWKNCTFAKTPVIIITSWRDQLRRYFSTWSSPWLPSFSWSDWLQF